MKALQGRSFKQKVIILLACHLEIIHENDSAPYAELLQFISTRIIE